MFVKIILFILFVYLNTIIYLIFNHRNKYNKVLPLALLIFPALIGITIINSFYHGKIGLNVLMFQTISLVVINLMVPFLLRYLDDNYGSSNLKNGLKELKIIADIMRLKIIFVLATMSQFINIFIL